MTNWKFQLDSKDKTIDRLWDSLNRVRMLHRPTYPLSREDNPCHKCGEQSPCSTINALKGAPFDTPFE